LGRRRVYPWERRLQNKARRLPKLECGRGGSLANITQSIRGILAARYGGMGPEYGNGAVSVSWEEE